MDTLPTVTQRYGRAIKVSCGVAGFPCWRSAETLDCSMQVFSLAADQAEG
ncbi:hypothetical protein [Streptomyces hydrogenans]